MDTCSFCRGPWHPESGNIVGRPVELRLCGPCVHEMKGWLRGHLNRKWGKGKFYENATVPPPATVKTFEFTVYVLVPGTTCTFRPREVRKSGVSFDEALHLLSQEYPGNHIAEHTRGLWKEVPNEAGVETDVEAAAPGESGATHTEQVPDPEAGRG